MFICLQTLGKCCRDFRQFGNLSTTCTYTILSKTHKHTHTRTRNTHTRILTHYSYNNEHLSMSRPPQLAITTTPNSTVPTFTCRAQRSREHVVTFGLIAGPATPTSSASSSSTSSSSVSWSPSSVRPSSVTAVRGRCAHRCRHHQRRRSRHRRQLQHAITSVAHAAVAPRLLLFDAVARLVRCQFLREPKPQSVRRSGAAGHRFPRDARQPLVRTIPAAQQLRRTAGGGGGGGNRTDASAVD